MELVAKQKMSSTSSFLDIEIPWIFTVSRFRRQSRLQMNRLNNALLFQFGLYFDLQFSAINTTIEIFGRDFARESTRMNANGKNGMTMKLVEAAACPRP